MFIGRHLIIILQNSGDQLPHEISGWDTEHKIKTVSHAHGAENLGIVFAHSLFSVKSFLDDISVQIIHEELECCQPDDVFVTGSENKYCDFFQHPLPGSD